MKRATRFTRSALKNVENLSPPKKVRISPCAENDTLTKLKKLKKVVKVDKTTSFKESFPGRLNWKRRHFDKPVTSTPTGTSIKSVFTKNDVKNCFGFEDSDSDKEENYSRVISPIPKAGKAPVVKTIAIQNKEEQVQNCIRKQKTKLEAAKTDTLHEEVNEPGPSKIIAPISKAEKTPVVKPIASSKNKNEQIQTRSRKQRTQLEAAKTSTLNEEPNKPSNIISPLPKAGKTAVVKIISRKNKKEQVQTRGRKPKTKLKAAKTTTLQEDVNEPSLQINPIGDEEGMNTTILCDEVNEPYLQIKPTDIGEEGKKIKDFNGLLARYNFEEVEDEELHLNPIHARLTYPAKRTNEKEPSYELPKWKTKGKNTGTKKVSKVRKQIPKTKASQNFGNRGIYDNMDPSTKAWLDAKNEEFKEVLKVNLIVE